MDNDIVCLQCFKQFDAERQSTFLGFKKYECPFCEKQVVYDLRTGYRIFYYVAIVVLVMSCINIVKQGDIPIPGLLGIAAVWGLLADIGKRREVRQAREHLPEKADELSETDAQE